MKITVNNSKFDVDKDMTLLTLLQEHQKNPETVLVSVNGNVVAKQEYANTILADGDQLDLMAFVGGG